MNIEQAKAIALPEILDLLGMEPVRSSGYDAMYLSPLHDERTASFHVNTVKNLWYDHGLCIGGNSFDFILQLLKSRNESHTPRDCLQWLRLYFSSPASNAVRARKEARQLLQKPARAWQLLDEEPIEELGLIRYLKSRGIPLNVAKRIMRQVDVKHVESGRKYFALGFQNDDQGWELRNPFLKTCVAPKAITSIRGFATQAKEFHAFEGAMDYASWLSVQVGQVHEADAAILNSAGLVIHLEPYLADSEYETVFTWFDNDEAGNRATQKVAEFCKSFRIKHKPMNNLYEQHKDVNAWHMHVLKLKPL